MLWSSEQNKAWYTSGRTTPFLAFRFYAPKKRFSRLLIAVQYGRPSSALRQLLTSPLLFIPGSFPTMPGKGTAPSRHLYKSLRTAVFTQFNACLQRISSKLPSRVSVMTLPTHAPGRWPDWSTCCLSSWCRDLALLHQQYDQPWHLLCMLRLPAGVPTFISCYAGHRCQDNLQRHSVDRWHRCACVEILTRIACGPRTAKGGSLPHMRRRQLAPCGAATRASFQEHPNDVCWADRAIACIYALTPTGRFDRHRCHTV